MTTDPIWALVNGTDEIVILHNSEGERMAVTMDEDTALKFFHWSQTSNDDKRKTIKLVKYSNSEVIASPKET